MKKYLFIVMLGFLFACNTPTSKKSVNQSTIPYATHLHDCVKQLTDVIVHDIFSPPVASRIYVYPSIAAYEILAQTDSNYHHLAGQLKELTVVPLPPKNTHIHYELAALKAYLTVGKALIFSEQQLIDFEEQLFAKLQQQVAKKTFESSIAYGQIVAQHILDWADTDNYKQIRSFPKFSVTDEAGRWQPTAPDYMEGIEPHWREIRTFVLDSAQQFRPAAPPPFDMQKGSNFYKEVETVLNTTQQLTDEQTAIAQFWDCNPYVSHHKGHFMFATKKISPGGHWIGIATIACKKASKNMLESAAIYALSSITLADAFISCWDEKYRSNLIRPETVIHEYLDEDWLPLLQTPPFPEHTSGHSVISAAAAVSLTHLLGVNFAFQDTVEVEYGLPMRAFNSFEEAAEEAAISRLYGGIHFMPAIEEGVKQGKEVGNWVITHIQLKK